MLSVKDGEFLCGLLSKTAFLYSGMITLAQGVTTLTVINLNRKYVNYNKRAIVNRLYA